jgi:phosphate/sulfate permease
VVGLEVLLGLSLLFVAPFLHGSARGQAYQAGLAKQSAVTAATARLPKLAPKAAHASTWVWGIAETILVIGVMIVGYRISERIARRRTAAAAATAAAGSAGRPLSPSAPSPHQETTSVP